MKRLFLFFSLLLVLFIMILSLIAFNLEFILNNSLFKERVKAFLSEKIKVDVDYKKVDVNIYKLLLTFENLKISSKDLEFSLPKGRLDFDWKRILTFNFYPSVVYMKNPHVKIYWSVEPSKFKMEELLSILKRISQVTLDIRNGTVEYEVAKNSLIRLEIASLRAVSRYPQFLLKGKVKGDAFSSLEVDLRYNLENSFMESSLKLKSLDLAKLRLKDLSVLTKTNFDLDLELSIEKGKAYAGFTGAAPCIAFDKGEAPVACGFFQGYFQGDIEEYELRLAPIDMKYPQVRGELQLIRTSNSYQLEGKLNELDWSHVKELLTPHLSTELAQELFNRIRGGHLTDLTLVTKGSTISKLLLPENLHVEGKISQGEFYIPEKDLTFTDTEGELSFKDLGFHFRGRSLVDEQIRFQVSRLTLNLLGQDKSLALQGSFSGDATKVKKVAIKLTEGLSFLKDWELKGSIMGNLNVSGKIESLQPSVVLTAEGLGLKFYPLKDFLYWERGSISFEGEKLGFHDLVLKLDGSYLRGIEGEINLSSLSLRARAKEALLPYYLLQDYRELKPEIYDLIDKYDIAFSEIYLKDLTFEGPLSREGQVSDYKELLQALHFKGDITSLKGQFSSGDYTLDFQSPILSFTFDDGKVRVKPSRFYHRDSQILIEGIFDGSSESVYLEGEGKIGEETLQNLQRLVIAENSSFTLKKVPINLERFSLWYDGALLFFTGKAKLGEIDLDLAFERGETLKLAGEISSKETAFDIYLKKERDYVLNYNGRVDFRELAGLFEKPLIFGGKLKGNLVLEANEEKWHKVERFWQEGDFSKTLKAYLRENPFTLKGKSQIESVLIRSSPEIILSGSFSFDTKSIIGKDLSIQYKKSRLSGEVTLKGEEDLLQVNGTLTLENLDLREDYQRKDAAKVEDRSLIETVFNLPLKGEISFGIGKLTLPTSHEVKNSYGKIILRENQLLRVELSEVNFCGLKLHTEFEKNPSFQYLFIEIPPTKSEFLDFFSCLYPEEMPRTILEGPFKIEGFFYTDGKRKLLEESYGKVEITSERGYLYRAPLLVRVLAFLSPIDLFRGKIPNLENNLLPYEELNFKGEIENTKLHVDTLFLSAPGFRLFGNGPVSLRDKGVSMTFLVSPFKTIDSIIEHIPYINKWILGKERMFIYLPIEVIGTYDQPQIVPLHPVSIGKGFFRFIFKFFGIQEEFYQKPRIPWEIKRRDLIEKRSRNNISR